MKLATSTLGCPDWTLEEILRHLPACGYQGVALRGLGPDLDLSRSPLLATTDARTRTRRAFAEAGLEICGLDSSARLAEPDAAAGQHDEARRYLDLAAELGAPAVRVFGGAGGDRPEETAGRLAENLAALCDYAAREAPGVSLILETHDAFSTGAQVAQALARVGRPQAGALWDLHHPYRQGEAPEATYAALAPFLRQTHVKDSRPDGGYCLLGEGDVPIQAMLALLARGGYRGYVTVEWEKRWHPELPAPEIAFPQYAATLQRYLAELPAPTSETSP